MSSTNLHITKLKKNRLLGEAAVRQEYSSLQNLDKILGRNLKGKILSGDGSGNYLHLAVGLKEFDRTVLRKDTELLKKRCRFYYQATDNTETEPVLNYYGISPDFEDLLKSRHYPMEVENGSKNISCLISRLKFLEECRKKGISVQGTLVKTTRGGFVINLLGFLAFLPKGQMYKKRGRQNVPNFFNKRRFHKTAKFFKVMGVTAYLNKRKNCYVPSIVLNKG